MQIGVIGPGDLGLLISMRQPYRQAGCWLHKGRVTLCSGGLSGMMEAASRGSKEEEGRTVGILPDTGKGNRYLDVVIGTGIGYARNVILIHSSDAVIVIGGS